MYEKSYMHRDVITHTLCTRSVAVYMYTIAVVAMICVPGLQDGLSDYS